MDRRGNTMLMEAGPEGALFLLLMSLFIPPSPIFLPMRKDKQNCKGVKPLKSVCRATLKTKGQCTRGGTSNRGVDARGF